MRRLDGSVASSKDAGLMAGVPIEVSVYDVRWLVQTVHNAYHQPPEGKGGVWQDCEKTVCRWCITLLTKHDAALGAMFDSESPFKDIDHNTHSGMRR